METYRLKIGAVTCIIISDGSSEISLERAQQILISAPPDELAAAFHALDISPVSSMNCAVLQYGDHTMLIDTGMGLTYQPALGNLLAGLAAEGIQPEDITRVFITHCHGDHIYGIVNPDGALTFPNADYVINKVEWDSGMSREDIATKLALIENKTTKFDVGDYLIPDVVYTIPLYGHTPGHTGFMVESEGEVLLGLVDTLHQVVQMQHPEWSPKFDSLPDVSPVIRRKMLEHAAQYNRLTLFYHLPFPGLGHVQREADGFKWVPQS